MLDSRIRCEALKHVTPPGFKRGERVVHVFYTHTTPPGFKNMTELILEKHKAIITNL